MSIHNPKWKYRNAISTDVKLTMDKARRELQRQAAKPQPAEPKLPTGPAAKPAAKPAEKKPAGPAETKAPVISFRRPRRLQPQEN